MGAASTQSVVWDLSKREVLPNRALLKNGAELAVMPNRDTYSEELVASDFDKKKRVTLVTNQRVFVEAAFPSNRNADAIIFSDICSGAGCDGLTIHIAVPHGDFLRTYRIGDAKHISLTLEDGILTKGYAKGIYAGADNLGNPVYESYKFIKHVGFVVPKFDNRFSHLVGSHPDTFFSDNSLRKPLVASMGADKFKDFRFSIRASSVSKLLRGRYILYQGCSPGLCDAEFSALLIDAVTGGMWWTRFKGNDSESGRIEIASRKYLSPLSTAIVSSHSDFDGHYLKILETGSLIYEKYPKSENPHREGLGK
jgi:hypothetical protein